MAEDIERISGRAGLQSRRFRKRLLAVRAMAGETAWLDGRLVWHKGRMAWETPRGPFSPGPGDLALAQRRLGQIAGSPRAAARALDDASAWLARRFARLETAKPLHALAAPDISTLARRARAGNTEAIRGLAGLLPAEAMCLNDLPASPSAALVPCGGQATGAVQAVVEDGSVPVPGRALAALVFGALHRQSAPGSAAWGPQAASLETGWLKRAYAWGLRAGLPSCPALTVTLLAGADGNALARRCHAAIAPGPFALPAQMLRDLLDRGVPAATVVATAEATVSGTAELLRRMMKYRDEIPGPEERVSRVKRRAIAEQLRSERQKAVSAVAEMLRAYLWATADPTVAHAFVRYIETVLNLEPLSRELVATMIEASGKGLSLPPGLHGPYLELLAEESSGHEGPYVYPEYVPRLLDLTKDAQVAREAIQLHIHQSLERCKWPDPQMYRLAVSLVRDLKLGHLVWGLFYTLDRFQTARATRAALRPLIQAIASVPEGMGADLSGALLECVSVGRYGRPRDIPRRLVAYVPGLIRFTQAYGFDDDKHDKGTHWTLIEAAMALDGAYPRGAVAWFDWLLSYLLAVRPFDGPDYDSDSISLAVAFAAALAEGDLSCFQEIIRAALKHSFNQGIDSLRNGIAALNRFPAVREPLAGVFPRQPHRCAELLAYLGLLDRLGKGASAPLAALDWEGDPDPATLPPGWQALVETLPELAPVAAAYVRAQELLGGSANVPSGVRRALEQPARLARELAYLEGLPDLTARPSLAARAANLRARLADGEGVEMAARSEAAECLRHVTAEAQFAATEQQLMLCYKTRLESVAGPLPDDLLMDEDLLNATLLTADIDQNRRLLLKLLRAHIAGDHRWPECYPPNVAFLKGLEERGVDVSAWLGSMPRTYKCAGVAGGRVRLYLETDPLHILQMGNYFDTCLSFGQMNAFSTVANACELNKRVIYARDGGGQVVGRKLIGISKEVELVGFRTYSTLPGDTAGPLWAIFNSYASDFAARCGLRLADEGEVPALFATWYDDGAVPWREEEAPGGGSKAATFS